MCLLPKREHFFLIRKIKQNPIVSKVQFGAISFVKSGIEKRVNPMPSINNENESDGDGEMSDNESLSSRDAKADSSEADEPDSDSSELDENECERRTSSFIKHMGK